MEFKVPARPGRKSGGGGWSGPAVDGDLRPFVL
jgi:hypothetical protein